MNERRKGNIKQKRKETKKGRQCVLLNMGGKRTVEGVSLDKRIMLIVTRERCYEDRNWIKLVGYRVQYSTFVYAVNF